MNSSVVALIPARGGSKGIANKNIIDIKGWPLIAYSIVAAKACSAIDRVIVTTDSDQIAEVARLFGAEIPFMRPAALAKDDSPDIDYVQHATSELARQGYSPPDLIVQLRPTTPLRDPALMGEAIAKLASRPDATSLRSVVRLPEPPQKMLGIEGDLLTGLFPDDPRPEYFNLPRQSFPPAYLPNGYIDIIRPDAVQKTGQLYGPRMLAFETPATPEIDTPEDMAYLSFTLSQGDHFLLSLMPKTGASVLADI